MTADMIATRIDDDWQWHADDMIVIKELTGKRTRTTIQQVR